MRGRGRDAPDARRGRRSTRGPPFSREPSRRRRTPSRAGWSGAEVIQREWCTTSSDGGGSRRGWTEAARTRRVERASEGSCRTWSAVQLLEVSPGTLVVVVTRVRRLRNGRPGARALAPAPPSEPSSPRVDAPSSRAACCASWPSPPPASPPPPRAEPRTLSRALFAASSLSIASSRICSRRRAARYVWNSPDPAPAWEPETFSARIGTVSVM